MVNIERQQGKKQDLAGKITENNINNNNDHDSVGNVEKK